MPQIETTVAATVLTGWHWAFGDETWSASAGIGLFGGLGFRV